MRRFLIILLIFFAPCIFAQQIGASRGNTEPRKFALVIGNGNYIYASRLSNSVNDANDIAAVLQNLGFTVDKVLNGSLDQMENAVLRLQNRLSASNDAYGFFYYAGHGVQSNGENYLLPVDSNIQSDNFLRQRAVSVQSVLDVLNDSGNYLNIVVLDACRDNPLSRSRGGERGLAVVSNQHADSIIIYSTSAGSVADDGTGRNGLFTEHLLNNLKKPGIDVHEVFRQTGADVAAASGRRQIPAVYNQFFGMTYLGAKPVDPSVFEIGAVNVATGSLEISTVTAGKLQIRGGGINQIVELPAMGSLPVEKINVGRYQVVMRYENGKTEEKSIEVKRDESAMLEFNYRLPEPKPVRPPREPTPRIANPLARLNTIGGSLGTSFSAPWLIGTVQGTISPFDYSFFDIGFDAGLLSGDAEVEYYSLYPFIRMSFFLPFADIGGWFAGAGAGLMITSYTFPAEGNISRNIFTADISTGFIFKNGFTFSYSLRTDFESANNKFAVGFLYRFK